MKTKVIFFLFLISFVFKVTLALEVKCNFEEVYSTGDVQNGIFLVKDKKMRYQYFDNKLYTIIYKNNNFYLIHNFNTNIVEKINKNTDIIQNINEIIQDYPSIDHEYKKNNFILKIEKNSKNFIKRISIRSDELNLSINIYGCDYDQIDNKYFNHFNFIKSS